MSVLCIIAWNRITLSSAMVLTPLPLKFQKFWDVVRCWSVRNCHYFAEDSCPQPDGIQRTDRYSWYYSWTTLKMEEGRSQKKSYLCTHLHSVTSQETVIFRLTAVPYVATIFMSHKCRRKSVHTFNKCKKEYISEKHNLQPLW
jgi:hypothetical protein